MGTERIEIEIPERLSKVDPELREKLLKGAIRDVASSQLREKELELAEAEQKTSEFENRYGKKLKDFEQILPADADHRYHEDLVEWSFWDEVRRKAESIIKDLRFVLGKD